MRTTANLPPTVESGVTRLRETRTEDCHSPFQLAHEWQTVRAASQTDAAQEYRKRCVSVLALEPHRAVAAARIGPAQSVCSA